jgi:hypothetical protein
MRRVRFRHGLRKRSDLRREHVHDRLRGGSVLPGRRYVLRLELSRPDERPDELRELRQRLSLVAELRQRMH